MNRLRTFLFAATCLIWILLPVPARAELRLIFDTGFSNTTVPFGNDPWLTAVFTATDPQHVQLTLTANLQDPDEFISNIYFNVAGNVPK